MGSLFTVLHCLRCNLLVDLQYASHSMFLYYYFGFNTGAEFEMFVCFIYYARSYLEVVSGLAQVVVMYSMSGLKQCADPLLVAHHSAYVYGT